jgi:hypothetical protein
MEETGRDEGKMGKGENGKAKHDVWCDLESEHVGLQGCVLFELPAAAASCPVIETHVHRSLPLLSFSC